MAKTAGRPLYTCGAENEVHTFPYDSTIARRDDHLAAHAVPAVAAVGVGRLCCGRCRQGTKAEAAPWLVPPALPSRRPCRCDDAINWQCRQRMEVRCVA